jgi:hypothetical protein
MLTKHQILIQLGKLTQKQLLEILVRANREHGLNKAGAGEDISEHIAAREKVRAPRSVVIRDAPS